MANKEFVFFNHVTRKQFFRWYEIMDLINKTDGRRSLVFDNEGYVADTETFLTGCVSRFPLFFMFDSSTVEWRVLSDLRKFKTLLDFYNNKITCQGFYYKDLKGYQREWLRNMEIETFCINSCSSTEKEKAIQFLKQ